MVMTSHIFQTWGTGMASTVVYFSHSELARYNNYRARRQEAIDHVISSPLDLWSLALLVPQLVPSCLRVYGS